MTDQARADMAFLLGRAEFRRFLFRSIQLAGILEYTTRATNGTDGRNLDWIEGRRSLGFDILRDADRGQPEPLQHPLSIMTLIAALREEAQAKPEKPSGRRSDRYADDRDDGSADD